MGRTMTVSASVKRAGELIQKIKSTRVPVGLEDDVDLAVAALAGGGEGGANLGGMVAVVVDHGDAARRCREAESAGRRRESD